MTDRRRTISRCVALGAAVLLAMTPLAACGQEAVGERTTSAPRAAAGSVAAPSVELVTAAGTRSAGAASVTMSATVTQGDETVSELTSTSNADGSRVAITSQMPGLGTFEARGIDGTWYLSLPSPDAEASWVSVDPEAFGGLAAPMVDGLVEADPRSVFDALSDVSSEVTEVGPDEVEGVPTTHYRMTIDARRLAPGVGPGGFDGFDGFDGTAELDVWIDDDGYVRRLRSEIGDPAAPNVFELTVSSYDDPVDVSPPAPEDTVSIDQFLAEGGFGDLGRIIGGN
jgi:hypothetical protein